MDINTFEDRIAKASPLEVPYLLMQLEQYDCETAIELFEQVNREFEREDLMNNVLNPVTATIVDSLLMLPVFKGFARKLGLSANRIIAECQSFNYDGSILYLQPDSFVEKSGHQSLNSERVDRNGNRYDRSKYENTVKMGRYKKKAVEKAGGKKNLKDEYTGENNITERKDNPDLRRNDPKNEYNAETDHIIPLRKIFEQVQNNIGLSERDVKNIANTDDNLAVTARRINNPKRDSLNSEFIRHQDELKAQGKPYVELSAAQRDNMIRLEREAQSKIEEGINHTVLKNLIGRGHEGDKKLGREKAYEIHKENFKCSGQQTMMYAIGTTVLFLIKPVYYELKDSFTYGFLEGVETESYNEAISIRFSRVKDYVWNQLKDLKHLMGSAMDIIKNFLSSIIEGIISMFVGIFKKAFRIVKECIKIFVQSCSVLFGKGSANATKAEKGDAIIKIIGASATALLGIWIENLLEKVVSIPFISPEHMESVRRILSTFLSGVASILIFYLLDKADLFNVKAERRNRRIKDIFDERIKDISDATESMNESVVRVLQANALESRKILNRFSDAFATCAYDTSNKALFAYADLMKIELGYASSDDFKKMRSRGLINWEM